MHLSSLTLVNFRSYRQRTFDFDSGINLIIGKNGSGKTNILESIYCLSVGKSFRSASLGQLITWTQNFAIIEAVLSDQTKLEFRLQQQDNSTKRQFLKDNVKKTKKLYFGSLFTIVFHPEDIRLVAGSPSRRRDFLDVIFSSASWRYHQALSQYNRALKHRNELLDLIRLNQSSRKELFFWDQSLIKNSQIIHHYRQEFIGFSNQFFSKHPHLEIRQLSLNYHPSVLTIQKLDSYFNRDLTKGYTSIGPHRDDFSFDNRIFPSPDQNSAHWGSRGQQRLAVLAVRLAQIEFIKQQTQQKPVLLLDDIFSELDDDHQRLVVAVCQNYQTIITSSDPATTSILPTANLIQL